MWIVRLALSRPYTFMVFSLLLLIVGPLAILNTPVDIFPTISIPVVSIIWNYTGLSAQQLADRIVSQNERALTTTVDGIDHLESTSLNGVAVVKIFFQPKVNIATAVAQVTAISQTQLKQFPPGTTPPLILQYSASSVPVLQLGLSGQGMSEQQLNDIGLNFVRTRLASVQGASLPYPYGGKQRQVQVDLNVPALQARGLAPVDVVNAISAQNLVVPSGTAKIGSYEYQMETNSAPTTIRALNDLPIKQVGGSIIYVRDVAHVRDGYPPQTNIVRVNGQRATLLTVLKTGNSSTLDIIKSIRSRLPSISASLPPQLRITPLADQSVFVRGAIDGVVREALIAACLTAVMILLFLGSWRSTVIIAVSIPLSILSSVIMLSALGETINIMSLGGLALAVGILVDDATVEIENVNRNLELGMSTEDAILEGAAQIAVPAFVSTIAICIVFVPMFFLSGVAKFLFVPLAEAVVFAMLASYFLSRTIVPTMANYLLKPLGKEAEDQHRTSRNPLTRVQRGFERQFEKVRKGYRRVLELCLSYSGAFLALFFVFTLGSAALLYPWLGQDFFPTVDGSQLLLHVRAPTGTRIEETARLCDLAEREIRREIPAKEIDSIIDNIGLPYSGLNLSYSTSAPVGPNDADITVSLAKGHHSSAAYLETLRSNLSRQFPGATFYALPVDMTTQILNFGLPAPLDIQVIGQNLIANHEFAESLLQDLKHVPGARDLRIQQPFDDPEYRVNVDRSKAQDIGLAQRDVAGNMLVALSGSFQTAPNFWLDPKNGVSYPIAVQSPQYSMASLQDIKNIPVGRASTTLGSDFGNPTDSAAYRINGSTPGASVQTIAKPVQLLGGVASFTRGQELATISHYDIRPVIDIYGGFAHTDLHSVDVAMEKVLDKHRKDLPRGSQIVVRGQVQTMATSFKGLLYGLAFSILLVYLLIVVNFQSWLDPFIIIAALPAALSGIIWFLFVTGTHISVPALTGAIMCMGVATANSVLVVSFAKEQLVQTEGDAREAALIAGFTRFRPVVMTALAMMIGMVPMALGLGDGGEQNAPLGRAVIGGLLFATAATLLFVPTFFSVMHGRRQAKLRGGNAGNEPQVV